jgi:hypothetical protein
VETAVSHQLLEVAASLALGATAGVLYDFLRVVRSIARLKLVTALCDLVFSAAAGVALFLLGLTLGGGRQRAMLAVIAVLGFAVYFFTLSRAALYFFRGLADAAAFLVWISARPAAFLLKIVKKFGIFAKKLFNYRLRWYIFRERRILTPRGRRPNFAERGGAARETGKYNYENTRVRGDRIPRVEARGHADGHSGGERLQDGAEGAGGEV